MHTQVMEGIRTAGTLEEGEVVWQIRTRARILHTRKHIGVLLLRYTCHSLNMYVVYYTQTARAVCTPLYTPASTGGDGRDLYRRNAGGR